MASTLSKFTIAPTLALDKAFWSRPELRFYYTYARWNRAAQQAAVPGSALAGDGAFGARSAVPASACSWNIGGERRVSAAGTGIQIFECLARIIDLSILSGGC